MKYKVIVIDDKPLIRQAIVKTIDWNALGCEVVAQAEDGLEGKQLIQELRPDILVTDIKMPGLSGLDLAELMLESLPQSKTILITGYQDFEYAKRAVRLGVFDFIVKPVNNDELSQVISSAVAEMDSKRIDRENVSRISSAFVELERQHSSVIPSLRSKMIGDMILGTSLESALQETGLHVEILFSRFVLLLVRAKDQSKVSPGTTQQELKRQLRMVLSERANQLSTKRELELIESSRHDDLMFVCLFPKVLPPREMRMKLQGFCKEFIDEALDQEQVPCVVAVSSVYRSLRELPDAYKEASRLMDTSFFRADESVLFPDQGSSAKEMVKFSIMQDLEQFNQMLENKSGDELIKHMESFLNQISVYSDGNILVVKGLLSEVCLAAARYYFRVTGDEFGLGRSVDQILGEVYRLSSLKEAMAYLSDFIGHIKKKLQGEDKEYSLIVKKVVDYINNHFAENINLTLIADHFGLSPSYLSRLLRTETGINFVDLVSKARIEAAKQLLMDPKNKVNEVGERVGYKEYAYFYQVFKRIEGQSPKEFKNRSKEN